MNGCLRAQTFLTMRGNRSIEIMNPIAITKLRHFSKNNSRVSPIASLTRLATPPLTRARFCGNRGGMSRIRNAENAVIVCAKIAEGFTIRQIARDLDCTKSAITLWIAEDAAFAAQYARAKEAQAEHFAEEIAAIADDGTNDWMEREGITVPDHEHIQRSKLRVDTRKWLMSKMLPKKYGDKSTTEITGADGAPLVPVLNVVLSNGKPSGD